MSNKTSTNNEGPKLQIKESLIGLFNLGVIVAEAVAAYVLYFSETGPSIKIVAAVLVLDAAVRAVRVFTVVR